MTEPEKLREELTAMSAQCDEWRKCAESMSVLIEGEIFKYENYPPGNSIEKAHKNFCVKDFKTFKQLQTKYPRKEKQP